MQQSKAYVIKNDARNRKATIAARKAEYLAYRYGTETPHAVQHLSPDELRLRLYARHGRTAALPAVTPTREQYTDQLEAVRCALIEAVYA